jgi:hypothetical protein
MAEFDRLRDVVRQYRLLASNLPACADREKLLSMAAACAEEADRLALAAGRDRGAAHPAPRRPDADPDASRRASYLFWIQTRCPQRGVATHLVACRGDGLDLPPASLSAATPGRAASAG